GDAKSADHLVQYPIFQPPFAVDDWDHVCYQVAKNGGATDQAAQALCGTTTGTLGSVSGASWVLDPITGDDHTTFVGGGSKDPNDISDWAADTGSNPDKDDIEHAYAVQYSIPPTANCPGGSGAATNCDVLYFGLDRFSNNGDAQSGFWFLQNEISVTVNKNGGGV